jgi:hypothetical protein
LPSTAVRSNEGSLGPPVKGYRLILHESKENTVRQLGPAVNCELARGHNGVAERTVGTTSHALSLGGTVRIRLGPCVKTHTSHALTLGGTVRIRLGPCVETHTNHALSLAHTESYTTRPLCGPLHEPRSVSGTHREYTTRPLCAHRTTANPLCWCQARSEPQDYR